MPSTAPPPFSLFSFLALTCAAILSSCGKNPPPASAAAVDIAALFPASLKDKIIRMVWVEQHPTDAGLWRVMAADSSDTQGIRPLTDYGDCARPIISVDGLSVFFTLMENGNPAIVRVNWNGSEREIMGPGFSTAAHRSSNGEICVLGIVHEPDATGKLESRAVSYQVGRPGDAELIWVKPETGVQAFSLSRDGRRGALLDGGLAQILHIQDSTAQEIGKGSWAGIAPDDSYVTAVFDSLNTSIHFKAPLTADAWTVSLASHSELAGAYVNGLRAGNDGRFFICTGPHPKTDGAVVPRGAKGEICVVMLDDDLKSVAHFTKITSNDLAEADPYFWIEDGESAVLTAFPQKPAGVPVESLLPWPASLDGLAFAWENARRDIQLGPEHSICRVEPRKFARINRWYGMEITGGAFEADQDAASRLATECAASGSFSLSFLLTESRSGRDLMSRKLISYQCEDGSLPFALFRVNNALVLRLLLGDAAEPPLDFPQKLTDLRITDGRPAHLAISLEGTALTTWLDGAMIAQHNLPQAKLGHWKPGRLLIGDLQPFGGPWEGSMEAVTLAARPIKPDEALALSQGALQRASQRAQADSVRLTGRLLTTTPIPPESTWGPYRRMLVANTYEVVSINAGRFEAPQITVLHWAVMDRQPVPNLPVKIGENFELFVDPLSAHPQLRGERKELGQAPEDSPLYYDIESPSINNP